MNESNAHSAMTANQLLIPQSNPQSSNDEIGTKKSPPPPLQALIDEDKDERTREHERVKSKLVHLIGVARDHCCYVTHFLDQSMTNQRREQWALNRARLLRLSGALLRGIDEILDSDSLRNQTGLIERLETTQRTLVRAIQQLLVELGPGAVFDEPNQLTRFLHPINQRITTNAKLNVERRLLLDLTRQKVPIWPGDFVNVARIPLGGDFGRQLNVRPVVEAMSRLVRQLEHLRHAYSPIVARSYVTMRVQSLMRGGYLNQAYLFLFAAFIYDSSENTIDLPRFRNGIMSRSLLTSLCPPHQLFQLIAASSNPACLFNFVATLNADPIALIVRASLHKSFNTFPDAQIDLNLATVQYLAATTTPTRHKRHHQNHHRMLPHLLQPLVQQIMSHDKKANIFETEHFERLFRICRPNLKLLVTLITSCFYQIDASGEMVMNDSLEHLFGSRTAAQLIVESLNTNHDSRLTLVKLTMKLFVNSRRVQLLTRIYLLTQLDSGKLHQSAARHIHQLIMINDEWLMDHYNTKQKCKRPCFTECRILSQATQSTHETSGLYHEFTMDTLLQSIQNLSDYPDELKVSFDKFDMFAVFKKLLAHVTRRIDSGSNRRHFMNQLIKLLAPRETEVTVTKVTVKVQSKLCEIIATFMRSKLVELELTESATAPTEPKRMKVETLVNEKKTVLTTASIDGIYRSCIPN